MYNRSMRWVTKATWVRIVALFGVYLLVSALWFSFARVSDSNEAVKSIAFLILLVVLPILAMCVATWDGVKEGFSLLWLVAPFVCFLAPMFLFFNASALIYGGPTVCLASRPTASVCWSTRAVPRKRAWPRERRGG